MCIQKIFPRFKLNWWETCYLSSGRFWCFLSPLFIRLVVTFFSLSVGNSVIFVAGQSWGTGQMEHALCEQFINRYFQGLFFLQILFTLWSNVYRQTFFIKCFVTIKTLKIFCSASILSNTAFSLFLAMNEGSPSKTLQHLPSLNGKSKKNKVILKFKYFFE